MELMSVRVLVGFFFSFSFFFLWSSFSSSAGLDSHLNFRSLEEPLAGEDGRGRGVGGGQEGESWVGGPRRKAGLLLAPGSLHRLCPLTSAPAPVGSLVPPPGSPP